MGMFSPLGCLMQVCAMRSAFLTCIIIGRLPWYTSAPHLNGTAGDFLRMLHRVGAGCGARVACAGRAVPVACGQPCDGCVTGCEFGSRGRPSSAHRAGDGSWGRRCEPGYRTPGKRRSPSRWARRTAGRCRTGQADARAGPCPAPAPRGRTRRSADAGPGSDEAHKRDEGDDAPCHVGAGAAAASVDEHIDDRQHIQGDNKANEGIDDAHKLRRHELGDVLGHWGVPFGILTVRSSLPRGLLYGTTARGGADADTNISICNSWERNPGLDVTDRDKTSTR